MRRVAKLARIVTKTATQKPFLDLTLPCTVIQVENEAKKTACDYARWQPPAAAAFELQSVEVRVFDGLSYNAHFLQALIHKEIDVLFLDRNSQRRFARLLHTSSRNRSALLSTWTVIANITELRLEFQGEIKR